MRDKKELIGISVVLGVIWSTYIVVATLLKQNHDITFWICCGFVSIATVIQWSIDYKLLIHQMNLKDYFFDFPVIYISAFLFISGDYSSISSYGDWSNRNSMFCYSEYSPDYFLSFYLYPGFYKWNS